MGIRSAIFAGMYDGIMKKTEKAGLSDCRKELLDSASGAVLEIGSGTGANLPYYGAKVTSLTLTDPSPHMAARLTKAVAEAGRTATVLKAPAEELPFEDDSFDTVVCTLVLCSAHDQSRAIREMRRVLKPEGRLLFLEHVLSEDAKLAKMQNRMNWLSRAMADGCNCNRSTTRALQYGGFDVIDLTKGELPKAPPFMRPMVMGSATPSR
jgi:ubiquinone/menaquinone biosynthesis C-methylase UbiE